MSHGMVEGGVKPPSSIPHKPPSFQHLKFVPNWNWHDQALCKGKLHLFFPDRSLPLLVRREYIQRAKAICITCPVRKDCFEFAKKNNESNGVWGGIDFHYNRQEERYIPDSID